MAKAEPFTWAGRPSQIKNLDIYVACFFGSFLIVPVFYAIYRYLDTYYTRYEVTKSRVFVRTGILTRATEEVELYRVKDYSIQQPFFLRLFYLYNVSIKTSDSSMPIILFESISDGDNVRNGIRRRVESLRDEKNIREVDFNG